MKPKMILKLAVDIAMTAALLLLMAYELVGQAAHEWIGIGMFALFIVHHILNGNWIRNILKGRYHPVRMMQTGLVLLILCAMVGLMISGSFLSRHALSFLPIKGGRSFARNLHMISAYWGFVLMSVHLGFHWSMILGMVKKLFPRAYEVWKWAGRILAFMIAGYGICAFIKRDIGVYMLLRSHFVFFDYEEPLVFFYLDYIAVMGLFILIGNYSCAGLRMIGRGQNKK
ncbi:MAG: DUF4405 domain-containing protein [Hungatella sp.]|jgi:hypothetical protein|nr:DUF4405 domain-containing protein [Lachnospiraceae bacterium]MCI8889624.1 DUF4405 domain-containing protein [Hungatella sp.]